MVIRSTHLILLPAGEMQNDTRFWCMFATPPPRPGFGLPPDRPLFAPSPPPPLAAHLLLPFLPPLPRLLFLPSLSAFAPARPFPSVPLCLIPFLVSLSSRCDCPNQRKMRLFLKLFVTAHISVKEHVRQAVLARGQGQEAKLLPLLLPPPCGLFSPPGPPPPPPAALPSPAFCRRDCPQQHKQASSSNCSGLSA